MLPEYILIQIYTENKILWMWYTKNYVFCIVRYAYSCRQKHILYLKPLIGSKKVGMTHIW